MMHLQRAGWLRAGRTQFVKWTMEGAVKGILPSILRRKAYVSCRGYVGILMRAGVFLKQGGTAEIGEKSVLDNIRKCILSGTFLRGYGRGLSMDRFIVYAVCKDGRKE